MRKHIQAILAVGILSTLVALAADQPAPGAPASGGPNTRGGGPGGQGGQGGRGNFQGRGGGGFGMPLDDQQRQLYQEAVQKDTDKLRALDEKLRVAQKELVEAVLSSSYDEKVVQTKAEAVAKIQVEITMLRAAALATVAPTLKPEQKQQLVESRFAIMMLSAGGTGGFGGGPGGFGGGTTGFGGGFRGQGGPTDAAAGGFGGGRTRQR